VCGLEIKCKFGTMCPKRGTVKVKKISAAAPLAILFLTTIARVHAQTGCVDSPEDPTVVFGLIAAAASFGIVHFRKRLGSRNK